jgi:superfamily II DNA or RNA helicase
LYLSEVFKLADSNQRIDFNKWILTPYDELQKHTLEIKKYWLEKKRNIDLDTEKLKSKVISDLPDQWEMLKGVTLYSWQKDCIDAWFKDLKGTIKVVTGAGKTILALAIIEHLQKQEQGLRVAIVVPTIVLLNQWKEEILSKSNLPEEVIGLLGGGHNDTLDGKKRILITVLKSASAKLPQIIDDDIGNNLLLVVDECHRAGASEMRQIFNTKRAYNLGLSATPEREYYDEELDEYIFSDDYNSSLLGQELGPIVYEMTLKEAFAKGILPKFELRHVALPLTPQERKKYESLSRTIQEMRDQLRDEGRNKGLKNDSALFSWCQSLAKQDTPLGALAGNFIGKSGERKRLLYNAKARSEAVSKLLKQEMQANNDTRAILFHESIEEVMNLYLTLTEEGIPVVAEHSELTEGLRANSIELFRKGTARAIVSARSLIEGFNVPSADLGIIVASSTSVRQRIQTLGRVLRKAKSGENDKEAVVYVLYMHDTTDEYIYEKTDWNKIIGAERNRYYYWDLKGEPEEKDGPPREPRTQEKDIDESLLVEGEEYPGDYEGKQYSCDSEGNVFDDLRRPAINSQGIPQKVFKAKKQYGRFKVTPRFKYVLALRNVLDDWQTIYVTKLQEDFVFAPENAEVEFDFSTAAPGDEVPNVFVKEIYAEFIFKEKIILLLLPKNISGVNCMQE